MTEKKKNDRNQIKIEFHADDYALFPVQSHRILDCRRNGNLGGISVMPNSPYLEECMSDLFPFRKDLDITVHLNLIEGSSLCSREEVPLLTEETGRLFVGRPDPWPPLQAVILQKTPGQDCS